MGGSRYSLTSLPPWGRPALELEVTAGSGFSAVVLEEFDVLEESAVLLEEVDALEESAALDAPGESIGASGGVAEEQATNKNDEKIIRISALRAIAKPSFMQSVDE